MYASITIIVYFNLVYDNKMHRSDRVFNIYNLPQTSRANQ